MFLVIGKGLGIAIVSFILAYAVVITVENIVDGAFLLSPNGVMD